MWAGGRFDLVDKACRIALRALTVPEPSTVALLAIGTLAITVGWWGRSGSVA